MAVQITRKTRNLEKLMKRIEALAKEKVESGYFKEQGKHSEHDLYYTELMRLHEYGFAGDYAWIPERPVRTFTVSYMDATYKYGWSKHIKKYVQGNGDVQSVLDNIGKDVTKYARSLFGNANILEPNADSTIEEKGFNAPLVDSGELMNNWAYRTSLTATIQDFSFV